MSVIHFLRYIIVNFSTMPLVIELALLIITFAIIFSIFSYIILLVFRYRSYKAEKRLSVIAPLIADLTFVYISEEGVAIPGKPVLSKAAVVLKLKSFLNGRRDRQIMVNFLIEYKKDLRGIMGAGLTDLFIKLELDQFSLKKLQRSRKYKKIQGLTELADMGVTTSDVHILPLTKHRSHQVRTIARHSYIKLSKNNPFKFMDSSKDPLLIWDQIELFRIITTNEIIPDVAPWLTYSTNASVVLFCLKLVVQFNQVEAIGAVVALLDTRDHGLRCAVINCLGKMRVSAVEPKLISMYNSQPPKCRVEIIKALGRFKTGNAIQFLKQEFTMSDDFTTKKNAAKSLVNNFFGDANGLQQLINSATPADQEMIKYCMNPMIKYV